MVRAEGGAVRFMVSDTGPGIPVGQRTHVFQPFARLDWRTPGAGLGLVGLSERATLGGGRLEAQRDGAAFVLRGWLPWTA